MASACEPVELFVEKGGGELPDDLLDVMDNFLIVKHRILRMAGVLEGPNPYDPGFYPEGDERKCSGSMADEAESCRR